MSGPTPSSPASPGATPHNPPTRAERSAANRAAWAEAAAKEKRREREEAERIAAEPPEPLGEAGEPDPSDPEALKVLFGAFYRRMWRIAHNPKSTNQDIVAGFGALRLATRTGLEEPPPAAYRLPFDTLLPAKPPAPPTRPDSAGTTPEPSK